MKPAMGSTKQGNTPVEPNDRSALEFIYMKPWRKSFVTREFLSNPVYEFDSDQASSQFPASHSIFSTRQEPSQSGYSFPVRCPNGAVVSNRKGRARGDAAEEDEAFFRLQEPGFWVTDEILEDEALDESSSDSEANISSEVEDEEKSIDEFIIEYAPELKLPSNVTVLKPNPKFSVDTQNAKRASFPVLLSHNPTTSRGTTVRSARPIGQKILNEELLRLIFEAEEYICPECLKVFPRDTTLEKHIKLMHDNSRPFVCTICEKRFTDANNLKVHKYMMHGPGKQKKKKSKAKRARLMDTDEYFPNITL